jgi:large subunit ribosomal protein L32e
LMVNKKRKYSFLKQGAKYLKRVKNRWRKPRGVDSKLKRLHKGKGRVPNIGYGAKRDMRYKHPSGFEEVLVNNVDDLVKVNPKTHVARISATVGKRKRSLILEKAKESKIKLLNA